MKVEIQIHNVKSQIMQPLSEVVIKALRSKLSAEMVGAFFARRANPYAGVKYFFTPKTQTFPTGMLSIVREVLDKYHIEYEHVDCRPSVQLGKELPLHDVILRDYQQQAVDLAVQKQRGIIRCGTGGGKSSILSAIIGKLNVPTLLLIHKTDVFYQLISTLERILQVPIGKIGDGFCELDKSVTVGMIQSLAHVFDPKVKIAAKEDKILKQKTEDIKQYLNGLGAVLADECFPSFQRVYTNKGPMTFGLLYKLWEEQKTLPLLLSYNEEEKVFEYKPITYAWKKELKEDLIWIKHGRRTLMCTKNHLLLTSEGYKRADSIEVGDFLIGNVYSRNRAKVNVRVLTEDQEQILLGSFLGDGHIAKSKNNRYRLRIIHGWKQRRYCKWKASFFHVDPTFIQHNGYSQKKAITFNSLCFDLKEDLPQNKTHCPQWVLDKLDARGLAIWFMDDGSLYKDVNQATIFTCSFDMDSQLRIMKKLKEDFKIDCHIKKHKTYYAIQFNTKGCKQLLKLISPYIPESMKYKRTERDFIYNWNREFSKVATSIVSKVSIYPLKKFHKKRLTFVYDLEVKDNHNYVVCGTEHLNHSHKSKQGIVAHNCHHISSDSFWTVLQNVPNALYRIGVTATAFREDNMDIMLEGALAQKFVDISSSDLIDRGFLVQPTIYLYPVEQERRQKGDPYSLVYNEGIVNNMERNRLICNLALKAKQSGKAVLISVLHIEHGEVLERMLQSVDKDAVFVNGQSKSEVRKQILKDLGKGVVRIVIASNIYSEGCDMPSLSVLINATGAASGIHSLQLLGRVLRVAPNKTKAWIIDLQDNGKFLNNHSKERVAIYSTEQRYQLIPVKDISEVDFK